MRFVFILILFFICELHFFSQQKSGSDSVVVYAADLKQWGSCLQSGADTLLKPGIPQLHLLLLGQYARPHPLILIHTLLPGAYSYRFQNFYRHRTAFTDSSLSIFRPKSLKVDIQAVAGSGDFQNLILNWIQPLTPALTYQIMFERFSAIGLFKNQKTTSSQFYFKTFYHPLKKPYGAWLQLSSSDVKSIENGGVQAAFWNDSVVKPNSQIIPVRLSDAHSRNRLQQSQFGFWYVPSPNVNIKTGINGDLKRNTLQYQDAAIYTDGFYTSAFRDTLITNDSVNHESLHFTPFINVVSANNQNRVFLNYNFEYEHVYFVPDRYFLNQGLSAQYAYNSNDLSWISGIAVNYMFNGYNKGNYRVDVNANKTYTGNNINMHASIQQRKPADMLLFYNSNHFNWDNRRTFMDEFWMQVDCNFQIKNNIQICGQYAQVQNFSYLDSLSKPVQYVKPITMYAIQAHFKHQTGSHLGAYGHLGFQYVSAKACIPAPPLYASLTLFIQGHMFKHNLQWQLGTQSQYFKSFISQAFMPALQSFYNPNRFVSTSTPWIDLYFSGRIRPVNFFIRAENIFYGLASSSFTIIESYPVPGRIFRMGLQWPFND